MRERRRSSLHEAAHLVALVRAGMPARARLARGGGVTSLLGWPTDDMRISETEIWAALAGLEVEMFYDPSRPELAERGAYHDLREAKLMIGAKHHCKGRELARRLRRARTTARRFVAREVSGIYAVARKLEEHGRVEYEQADRMLAAVDEVTRRRREDEGSRKR